MKRFLTLAAGAALGMTIFNVSLSSPAEAKTCYYGIWQDGRGMIGTDGVGNSAKMSWACNRARRECNRKLDRARKKGTLPRGHARDFRCKRYG